MRTATKVVLNRATSFFPERKPGDKGDIALAEVLEMIREKGQTGYLAVHIGRGGTIAALIFHKEDRIPASSEGILFSNEEPEEENIKV